jgi:amino acid transporter
VGGVIVIGWLVPYNDPRLLGAPGAPKGTAASSPFVIAMDNAKIKALPSIINAVVLTSAFSAGNSVLYASSRTLYGLACAGQAPRFLRKCTKEGLPIWCVSITCQIPSVLFMVSVTHTSESALAGFLAYMNVNENGGVVFEWFVNITSITGLITWDIILITYVRFYQGLAYHGIDRDKLPYKAPFQPYASYFGIFCINLIILFNGFQVFLSKGWDVNTFVAAYICLPIFLVFYFFWKILMLPKFVRVADMDFTTGRRELSRSKCHHYYQLYCGFSDACEQWRKRSQPNTWFPKVSPPRCGIGLVSTLITYSNCKICAYHAPWPV